MTAKKTTKKRSRMRRNPRPNAATVRGLDTAEKRRAWVSAKIAQLRAEDYPEEQAIAVAFHEAQRPFVEQGSMIPADLLPKHERVKRNKRRDERARQIAKAAKLFGEFREEPPTTERLVGVARYNVGVVMGKCVGIMYETTIAGRVEKYLHQFALRAAPRLVSSWDGKQLLLVGGHYKVGPRGIVDQRG